MIVVNQNLCPECKKHLILFYLNQPYEHPRSDLKHIFTHNGYEELFYLDPRIKFIKRSLIAITETTFTFDDEGGITHESIITDLNPGSEK